MTKGSIASGPCGTRVDRYDVEKRLGGGGFGAVYLARHSVLGHKVALKLLLARHASTAEVVARFVREAKSSATIKNPHVVSVTDFGQTNEGAAFLVMELLEGRDLETVLRDEGAFSPEWALAFAEQILEGLAAAHHAGIVHRDMKPANVFVSKTSDGKPWVKLVDFGISKAPPDPSSQQLTRTGSMIGTPSYMPPEQFTGTRDVDHRADLYAATVILYQLLSGRLPYEADTYERLIVKVCSEPPTPLETFVPFMPQPVLALLRKGLAREPGDRFQSAEEFRHAIHQARAALHPGNLGSLSPKGPMHPNAPHLDIHTPPHLAVHTPQHLAINTPQHLGMPTPQTPMAFERTPTSHRPAARTSTVLIVLLVIGVLGVLAFIGVIALGLMSESDDDSFSYDSAPTGDVSTESPQVSNGDPVLADGMNRILASSIADLNACRLPSRSARVTVRIVIEKGYVKADESYGTSEDEALARCLAMRIADKANQAGSWPADYATIAFVANVPPSQ